MSFPLCATLRLTAVVDGHYCTVSPMPSLSNVHRPKLVNRTIEVTNVSDEENFMLLYYCVIQFEHGVRYKRDVS